MVGLIFLGKLFWPPPHVDGSCQVNPAAGVTFECVRNGKADTFDVSMANITLEDGSVKHCAPFRLSDRCKTLGVFGSDKPAEVLSGEVRPCKLVEEDGFQIKAGSCVEPSFIGGGIAAAIIFWIMAAGFFCFCCMGGIMANPKDDDEDSRELLEEASDIEN